MALVTVPSASTARLVTLLYSFSSVWVRACCVSVCIADLTVAEPYRLELLAGLTLWMRTAPPVLTWYCSALSPDKNTALPVTEIQVNNEGVFLPSTRSPMLPPQPTVEPSGDDDCQVDCWSLCEKSLGGCGNSFLLLLLKPARLIGTTSGPTLSCTAALPLSNKLFMAVIDGCNAYWRPLGSGAIELSAVAARSAFAMAMPPPAD